jgi:hypothetical protein
MSTMSVSNTDLQVREMGGREARSAPFFVGALMLELIEYFLLIQYVHA